MTFQPDITRPGEDEIEDHLYKAAWELRGIERKDLLRMVSMELVEIVEHDQPYGLSWSIDGVQVLTWNSGGQHFVKAKFANKTVGETDEN